MTEAERIEYLALNLERLRRDIELIAGEVERLAPELKENASDPALQRARKRIISELGIETQARHLGISLLYLLEIASDKNGFASNEPSDNL